MRQRITFILHLFSFLILWTGPDPCRAAEALGAYLGDSQITPHKAVYELSLETAKNKALLLGADGELVYEWKDDCARWDTEQRLLLHMAFDEGDDMEIKSVILGRESKDGKHYKFTAHTLSENGEDDVYKGEATQGGPVVYTLPKNKAPLSLSKKDYFPIGHTKALINAARQGVHFFSATMFDGSEEKGLTMVSSFIGASQMPQSEGVDLQEGASDPILKKRYWPIRMAFFQPENQEETPEYEMDIHLQENGVIRFIRLDYGDFVLTGKLKSIKANPICLKK